MNVKKLLSWLLYAAVLLGLSLVVYSGLLGGFTTRVFADNDDSSLFIWWIAHTAGVAAGWFGRGSGESGLLYTTAMNTPDGVNGAWNTSVIGIGLPLVPVTWLVGPVASYNLAIICAPIVSALAAAALARMFTRRIPAFLAGILYGFSTYVIAQSSGHLNLASAAFPPLVVLMMLLVVRSKKWIIPFGIILGWQFYISTELLAGTFLAVVVLAVCAAAAAWTDIRDHIGPLLICGAAAAAIGVVIALPLLITMMRAPNAPQQAIRPHGVWNTDVLDAITPGKYTLVGGGGELPRIVGIDPSEIGGYLSLLWIIVCASAAVILWKRSAAARTAALTGLGMWLLSLGSPILMNGSPLIPVGPFRLVELLPVLGNILPMRLIVHTVLAAAVLSALLVDRGPSKALRGAAGALLIVVIFLTTTGPVPVRELFIPYFYRTAAAQRIEEGSVVKTLPRPRAWAEPRADEAMVWQAVAGLRYSETGGYFIGGSDDQPVTYASAPDGVDILLEENRDGPVPIADELRPAVRQLCGRGVDYIVIADDGFYLPQPAPDIARELAAAAGAEPEHADGVWIIELDKEQGC